jgi:hypothetical protein
MVEIEAATVLSLTPSASFQGLGDGAVILMIDTGQLYTCNETTEFFLKLIDGNRSFGEIIDQLSSEFAASRETLASDFIAIAGELYSQGIIEVR